MELSIYSFHAQTQTQLFYSCILGGVPRCEAKRRAFSVTLLGCFFRNDGKTGDMTPPCKSV